MFPDLTEYSHKNFICSASVLPKVTAACHARLKMDPPLHALFDTKLEIVMMASEGSRRTERPLSMALFFHRHTANLDDGLFSELTEL